MPGLARLRCWRFALGSALLTAVLLQPVAAAQEGPKTEIVPRIAHTGYIGAAAFSPGGALVLTAGGMNARGRSSWDDAR